MSSRWSPRPINSGFPSKEQRINARQLGKQFRAKYGGIDLEAHFRLILKYSKLENEFKEQVKLIPKRKITVDFYCERLRLVVECEGGIWKRGGGGHSHPMHIMKDIERQNMLEIHGFRLLRYGSIKQMREFEKDYNAIIQLTILREN